MNDLDTFITGLYATGPRVKTSGLDGFDASELGLIYGTPASHLEAAEKLAYDAHCFLEQFEGTPLHAQAIALVGEELGIEAERIQRDEARRAQQEPLDDSWSKQRMIDLKKRQLELELHKAKAGAQPEGQEQEAAEHAEGVPAPQTTGAVPAKTAALKLAVSPAWVEQRIQNGLKGKSFGDYRALLSRLQKGSDIAAGKIQTYGDKAYNAHQKYETAMMAAHRHNTVAAEALKRGELDLEKAAGLQDLLTRLTSTRAQRLAKMDARGAAALAKSRAASPARSAVRGMIDELRGSMPKTTASEVSGVRRLPTPEAARISRSVSDYLTKKASLGARAVAAAQRGAQQAATGMASRAAFPAVAKAPPTAPNAASFLAKKSPYMLKVPGSR